MRILATVGVLSALSTCFMTVEPWAVRAESYSHVGPPALSARPTFSQRDETADSPTRGRSGRLQTREGVNIGELRDILIEPEKGCIAYGVFSPTDGLSNDHMVILPWMLVQLDPADLTLSTFRLQVEREILNAAPHLSREQWVHAAVTEWVGAVERYWAKKTAQRCAASTAADARVVKASDVVGMNIRRDNGEELGTIRELVMDGERGTIASAVVAREDPSAPNHRIFFSLPWKALYLNTSGRTCVAHLGAKTAI